MIHLYQGTVFDHKKRINFCYLKKSVWISRKLFRVWKANQQSYYIIYNSIYIAVFICPHFRNWDQNSGCWTLIMDWGRKKVDVTKEGDMRILVMKMFCIFTVSMPIYWLWYCNIVSQDASIREIGERLHEFSLYYFLELHVNL